MAQCVTCGNYYRRSPYNATNECDSCVDQVIGTFSDFDDEDRLEVETLLNPTGRKLPNLYSD
ncbi:MAG: hypothetical protein LC100_14815 [Chitinophagales bacterium]|nr:hypothetical protein [Chitinophagales bacterium]